MNSFTVRKGTNIVVTYKANSSVSAFQNTAEWSTQTTKDIKIDCTDSRLSIFVYPATDMISVNYNTPVEHDEFGFVYGWSVSYSAVVNIF